MVASWSPKYLLCPGGVVSRTDRQWHFVDARQLAFLYGVSMAECVVWSRAPGRREPEGLIQLRPRYGGDYRVPS